jgi:hypothetical protein
LQRAGRKIFRKKFKIDPLQRTGLEKRSVQFSFLHHFAKIWEQIILENLEKNHNQNSKFEKKMIYF